MTKPTVAAVLALLCCANVLGIIGGLLWQSHQARERTEAARAEMAAFNAETRRMNAEIDAILEAAE